MIHELSSSKAEVVWKAVGATMGNKGKNIPGWLLLQSCLIYSVLLGSP
jgi:hypothetical protein